MTAVTPGWSRGGENISPSGFTEKVLGDDGGGGGTSGGGVGDAGDPSSLEQERGGGLQVIEESSP